MSTLIGLFLYAIFTVLLAFMVLNSPEGYEDMYGFHYGKQPSLY